MSALFQEASDLNNKGVEALLEGDQTTAIPLLERSIKIMRSVLAKAGSSSQKGDQNSSSTSRSMHNTHTVEIPSMETSDSIVFNQAICLPTDAALASYCDKNIYASAVVFNYALLHHFKASAGDEASMDKAETLYGMVLKMQAGNACGGLPIAIVIKLACINNLSQIRYCKGDYENGREGFRQVSRLIRKSSTNQSMLKEPKVQGLLMNVLLLLPPVVARAA